MQKWNVDEEKRKSQKSPTFHLFRSSPSGNKIFYEFIIEHEYTYLLTVRSKIMELDCQELEADIRVKRPWNYFWRKVNCTEAYETGAAQSLVLFPLGKRKQAVTQHCASSESGRRSRLRLQGERLFSRLPTRVASASHQQTKLLPDLPALSCALFLLGGRKNTGEQKASNRFSIFHAHLQRYCHCTWLDVDDVWTVRYSASTLRFGEIRFRL